MHLHCHLFRKLDFLSFFFFFLGSDLPIIEPHLKAASILWHQQLDSPLLLSTPHHPLTAEPSSSLLLLLLLFPPPSSSSLGLNQWVSPGEEPLCYGRGLKQVCLRVKERRKGRKWVFLTWSRAEDEEESPLCVFILTGSE